MAAIVKLYEWNGPTATPTKTDKTDGVILPRAEDSPAVDSLNPIPIPKTGISFSYEKYLRFRIGATGPVGQITNLVFFTGGINVFGIGITLFAGATPTYTQPVISNSIIAVTDASDYIISNKLDLGAGPFTGSNVDIGNFCVLQVDIEPTAVEGLSGTLIPVFSYDET